MSYTTPSAVQSILGRHYDRSTDLTPFIETAARITQRVASKDAGAELTSVDLELIERWLAAHFYAQADPILQSTSVGKSGGVFEGKTDMGLKNTRYGLQALALDASGYLTKISNGVVKVGMKWLGKPPSEQTDYEDRD